MRSKVTTTLAVAAAALAPVACGEPEDARAGAPDAPATPDAPVDVPPYRFEDIDMNTDSALDASEFRQWSESPASAFYMQRERTVDPYAPVQTGALDNEVLIDALYAAWDIDDDQALDRSEWDAATRVIETVPDAEAVWLEFDADGSQTIEIAEVRARLEDDILAGIDADEDGLIDDGEMNRWFFALFDLDDDSRISKEEWRLAEIYFDVPVL